MSKALRFIIALIIIGALGFALNPSAEKHREKIKEAIAERSQIEHLLGIGHLTSFVSRYHNVAIASYTTVNEKIISVGAYGVVFVLE